MPTLKSKLTKAEYDALPEARRELYVEKDGTFVLDADIEDVGGLKSALEKERTTRGTLEKTLSDLRKQLGDADPAKAREALARLQELEDKKLIDEGKVEELLKSRTERLVQDYEGRLKGASEKLTTAERRLAELVIDNELRTVATAKKVRPEAVEDFLERGRKVYKLVEGKAVPMKGDQVVYGKKANEPMSMDEWADSIIPAAPHLFEGSSGGGASNGGGGGGPRGPHTISAADAKDRAKYLAAKDAATKAGQTLTIVD